MIRVNYKTRQSGFSLIVAIFIMLILGMMGSYMVSTSVMQRQTTDYALQGARVYKAAQSGIQWAAYQIFNGGWNAACGAGAGITTNLALTANGLNGFNAAVTCGWVQHTDQGNNFCVFRVNVIAEFRQFGQPDYVSRRLEAVISDDRANPVSGC